jgi:hypothetical protein
MPYPEVPMEVVYFMFGVIVGMFLTGALFITLHYVADKKRNEALNKIGVFRREDVSEEFLKTIDGIEENLKCKK